MTDDKTDLPPDLVNRRDFLTLLTASSLTVGGVAMVWPFLNSLTPPKTKIAQRFIDVDIHSLKEGQQITAVWHDKPILVIHRSPKTLELLQDPALLINLRDPNSKILQQPTYSKNWHRSIEPRIGVFVGICTHLGCIPSLAPSSLGGYYNCACHGSKFDLAGRVFESMPAPYNLPIPPYHFIKPNILRIGENPEGYSFDLQDIVQI